MSETMAAIVTGAGSGVGRCVARRLGRAGYRVALVGRTEQTLRETGVELGEEGAAWIAVVGDVADDADREAAVEETLRAFGRVDALVNNAGAAPVKSLREHTIDELRACFEVNALGPIDLAARCVRAMVNGGVVVFTSSMAARDPFPGLGVYGCAKSAVNAACRAIANEEAGVRAYAVAPGAIETGMLRAIWGEDVLPREKTLDPDFVAEKIVACVTGGAEIENGGTLFVPSP